MTNTCIEPPVPARRVLLIAADPSFREWSVSALRGGGFYADGEGDAEGAWAALRGHGYEVLVINHPLQGGAGLRLVLSMSHANLTLPIILITEFPAPFDPLMHSRLRSLVLLPRPFHAEELLEIVHRSLRNRPSAPPAQTRPVLVG